MTSRLSLALIGCGYITQAEHVPALLALRPEIEVAVAVDTDPLRAAAVAAALGSPSAPRSRRRLPPSRSMRC